MEKLYFYNFYKSKPVVLIRFFLIIGFTFLTALFTYLDLYPQYALAFLLIVTMLEIYFKFYVCRFIPRFTVETNSSYDSLNTCTLQALRFIKSSGSLNNRIKNLLSDPLHHHFIAQLGIDFENDFNIEEVDEKYLLTQSTDIVRQSSGKYITTIDLITAYLLHEKSVDQILIKNKIRKEDLIVYHKAKRKIIEDKQAPKPFRINFKGEGFAESLIYGWTPTTATYTSDYTSTALRKVSYRSGRNEEYEKIINSLSKAESNNILIVGDIGVGKESLINNLVHDSYSGKLPKSLNHKRLLELNVSSVIAGANEQGAIEERLNMIIEEVSHSSNVILYIPQFQDILGSSDFKVNLSGVLLPHLKDGRLPIIASMSQGNYKQYLQKNPLREVFQTIEMKEPDRATCQLMLIDKSIEIERQYNCTILLNSITAAIEHASTYLVDEYLPGSAVKLLSQAANNLHLKNKKHNILRPEDVIHEIESKTKVNVGEPDKEEKNMLLNLEDLLHKRVVNQTNAIGAVAQGIRRTREGFSKDNKPISFLFLGPTGVGKTETAKALSEIYYKGSDNMVRLDMSEYKDEDGIKRLLGAPPGEGDEPGELTDKIHDKPYSLLLVDEFEKAYPAVLDLFLQILDDGRLTDNKGKTVSFANTIIIATSNAGSELIRDHLQNQGKFDKEFNQQVIDYLQEKNIFKPELLNRFDEVVLFSPLGVNEVKQISRMLMDKLVSDLKAQDIYLHYDDKLIDKIANEGSDVQFGARPLRRYIQDSVEDLLAKLKLQDKIVRGNTVTLSVGSENEILVDVSK